MEPLQFYQRLREHDGSRVESLVRRLRRQDFQVYATGSSLRSSEYNDIDLVVTPQSLDDNIEVLKLKYAREKLDRAIFSFLEHTIKAECRGLTGKAVVHAEYHFSVGEESATYAYSGVEERRRIEVGGTSIDLVLTGTPFLTNPSTERVKL